MSQQPIILRARKGDKKEEETKAPNGEDAPAQTNPEQLEDSQSLPLNSEGLQNLDPSCVFVSLPLSLRSPALLFDRAFVFNRFTHSDLASSAAAPPSPSPPPQATGAFAAPAAVQPTMTPDEIRQRRLAVR